MRILSNIPEKTHKSNGEAKATNEVILNELKKCLGFAKEK